MKRLNLRTPKSYNYDSETGTISPRKRFYCISEGPSEESYFYGIRNNRANLRIKNDIFIEVVEKEKGQETYSHPLQLVNACLTSMGHIDDNGKEIEENEWEKNCKWSGFDPKTDEVCVIFDRDYKDLEVELDKIFNLCRTHNIRIILSNPNFELWLLMHRPNIEKYNNTALLQNKRNLRNQLFEEASTEKKYLEILVSKNFGGYRKGQKLKFERFLPYIDIAVAQAKLYSEEPSEIKEHLGTAMGKLIEDMRS